MIARLLISPNLKRERLTKNGWIRGESKEEENNKNLTSSILEEPMGININELDSLIEVDTSDEVKTDTNYINI